MLFDFLIGIMSSDSKSDKPVRHRPWVNNWAEMKTHERFTNGCLELKTFPQLFQQQQDNQKVEMPTETIVVTTDDLPSLLLVTEDLPSSSLETALFSEDPVLAPLDANTPLMLGRSVDFLPLMSVKRVLGLNKRFKKRNIKRHLKRRIFKKKMYGLECANAKSMQWIVCANRIKKREDGHIKGLRNRELINKEIY